MRLFFFKFYAPQTKNFGVRLGPTTPSTGGVKPLLTPGVERRQRAPLTNRVTKPGRPMSRRVSLGLIGNLAILMLPFKGKPRAPQTEKGAKKKNKRPSVESRAGLDLDFERCGSGEKRAPFCYNKRMNKYEV